MLPTRAAVLNVSSESGLAEELLRGLGSLGLQRCSVDELRLDHYKAGPQSGSCAFVVGTGSVEASVDLMRLGIPVIWMPYRHDHVDWWTSVSKADVELKALVSPCLGVFHELPLRCPRLAMRFAPAAIRPLLPRQQAKPAAMLNVQTATPAYEPDAARAILEKSGWSVVASTGRYTDLVIDIPDVDPHARYISMAAWSAMSASIPVIHGANAAEASDVPQSLTCVTPDRLERILELRKHAPESFHSIASRVAKVANCITWEYRLRPVMHMMFPTGQDRNAHQEEGSD